MKTVEEYLREHAVIDGQGNMDGSFVPLSVAMASVEKALRGELEVSDPTWIKDINNTNPYIWQNGWYAILNDDSEENDVQWWVAPKDHFDERGYCSDGWEWKIPTALRKEGRLDEFIEEYGCEPNIPKGFVYCMESCIEGPSNKSVEEQRQILKDFGFTVDNIPKWGYER